MRTILLIKNLVSVFDLSHNLFTISVDNDRLNIIREIEVECV